MSSHDQCATIVVERLAVIVERSGQRGSPTLVFDAKRTNTGRSLRGEPVWSPAVYHARTDTLAVNLELVIGPDAETAGDLKDDPGIVGIIDGLLGHELGHRRRRWLEWWSLCGFPLLLCGVGSVVYLAATAVRIGWPDSDAASVANDVSMATLAAAMCSFLLWCIVALPFRRWRERRADVAMVRYAGVNAAHLLFDGLARLVPAEVGGNWVHESPLRRRARVDQFVARHGHVIPVVQTARQETKNDDWR